jgi:UPF0716 family protein affecting phage T7 exclusion
MLPLQLAVGIFLFVLTMYILVFTFITVVMALGPWWTIAAIVVALAYRHRFLQQQYRNQQRGLQGHRRRPMKEINR